MPETRGGVFVNYGAVNKWNATSLFTKNGTKTKHAVQFIQLKFQNEGILFKTMINAIPAFMVMFIANQRCNYY